MEFLTTQPISPLMETRHMAIIPMLNAVNHTTKSKGFGEIWSVFMCSGFGSSHFLHLSLFAMYFHQTTHVSMQEDTCTGSGGLAGSEAWRLRCSPEWAAGSCMERRTRAVGEDTPREGRHCREVRTVCSSASRRSRSCRSWGVCRDGSHNRGWDHTPAEGGSYGGRPCCRTDARPSGHIGARPSFRTCDHHDGRHYA